MGEKVLELYRSIEKQASEAAARNLDAFAELVVDEPPKG
jgi:molybdenum-dependent DNA-binding transcriptional regulator ModE